MDETSRLVFSRNRIGARQPRRSLARLVASAAAILLARPLSAAAPAVSPAERPTAYEQLVAPILRARCVECHGEAKRKGRLALHTWETFAKGGANGPAFVAGKTAESELLIRLKLPLAEEDHMPPRDEPQPAPAELALLERWIAAGASPTATVESLQLPADLIAAVARLPASRARATVATLDLAEVEKLRAPLAATVAALQQKFPGALSYESRSSAALHFTAAGLGRDFGDAELAQLLPLASQLVRLDLAATAITDRSGPVLARLTALRVLRAGFTAISDDTLPALAPLTALEAFSVNHTAVTDRGLAALKKLPALRELHLAGTAVSPDAARKSGLPVVASAAPEPLSPPSPTETPAPSSPNR
ncbi:MAG: hypothetical protein HZA93_23420 [Verrucomicrobia bacterium]|nr:hypothetical protein [Verrucomicrobiota bacterium]